MNYIQEILLGTRAQGLSDNELFFARAKNYSLWYEQFSPCLNGDMVTGPVMGINSLYRFFEVSQDLLYNMEDSEYLRHLFGAAAHILTMQEAPSGLSKRDFYTQMLKRESEGGGFSTSIAQALQPLPKEQKRGMASLLLAQYETGPSLLVLHRALAVLYPRAVLCQLKPYPEQLPLYLGLANMSHRIVQMLEDLFFPLQYQARILWTRYFGVWDVDAILAFDEVGIY